MNKISIRFFNDREVRAVWDDAQNKWWFCAVDVAAVLSGSENPIDGQSKKKAYALFESGMLESLEPGSVKCTTTKRQAG